MRNISSACVYFLVFASISAVQAQEVAQSAPTVDVSAADCDKLTGMPNAPMSVEACRTMIRMDEDDPSTHRPGDETMSCNQIFAELRTMQGEGVSEANAAQTDTVFREAQALGALHAAEMARQMTPSPLAIASSFLPNAVGALLMAPEQARTVAAMAKLKAEDERYSALLHQHMTATTFWRSGGELACSPELVLNATTVPSSFSAIT